MDPMYSCVTYVAMAYNMRFANSLNNKSDEKNKLEILIYSCLANPVSCKYILDMSMILPTESRLCQVPCRRHLCAQ